MICDPARRQGCARVARLPRLERQGIRNPDAEIVGPHDAGAWREFPHRVHEWQCVIFFAIAFETRRELIEREAWHTPNYRRRIDQGSDGSLYR